MFNTLLKNININSILDYGLVTGLTIVSGLVFSPSVTILAIKLGIKAMVFFAPIVAAIKVGLLEMKMFNDLFDLILNDGINQATQTNNTYHKLLRIYNKLRRFFIKDSASADLFQNALTDAMQNNQYSEISYNFIEEKCENTTPCIGNFEINIKGNSNDQQPILFKLSELKRNLTNKLSNNNNPMLCTVKETFKQFDFTSNLSCKRMI